MPGVTPSILSDHSVYVISVGHCSTDLIALMMKAPKKGLLMPYISASHLPAERIRRSFSSSKFPYSMRFSLVASLCEMTTCVME